VSDAVPICAAMSTNADAATATSALVRSPAVRCLTCRSKPMSEPSAKAEARLMNESTSVATLRWTRACSVIGGSLLWWPESWWRAPMVIARRH